MKKILLIAFIAILPQFLAAQSALDALRYSQNFYTGTARSAAMGNAVTALGGDFGALSINPASSAVYPYTEFIFTPSLHNAATKSTYLDNNIQEGLNRPGITNIGYVKPIKIANYSRLVGFSFGIGYNALNNFADHISVNGTTNQSSWLAALACKTNGIHATHLDWNDYQNPFHNSSASWKSILAWNTSLLDTLGGGSQYLGATEEIWNNNISIPGSLRQNYSRKSVGNVGEYVINMGLNFGHQFYLGANIGIQSIYYELWEKYSESAVNPNEFWQTQFNRFAHEYHQKTVGVGVNFKLGAIFLPAPNLRLGASISTPTWMSLNEEWEEKMTAVFSDYNRTLQSPLGTYEYRVNAPFRLNLGVAYTLGSLGALSVDYERVAFKKTYMSGKDENFNPFSYENQYLKDSCISTNNYRAGLELNLTDILSLRGGYAFYENPERSFGSNTHIASLGVGMRWDSFFTDLTVLQQVQRKEGKAYKEHFALYDNVYDGGHVVYPAPVGTKTTSYWRILLSFGFRF